MIPIIYRGKEEAVMLDPRAIVFTPLDPRSSARWTTPRATSPWTTMPPGPGSGCSLHPHWGVPGCELDWERAITPVKKGQQGLDYS